MTDVSDMAPCSHEEADTRIILHVGAATKAGHRNFVIRTSDSDVVVLAVWAVSALQQRINHLWVALGTGHNFRYLFSTYEKNFTHFKEYQRIPVLYFMTIL